MAALELAALSAVMDKTLPPLSAVLPSRMSCAASMNVRSVSHISSASSFTSASLSSS